MSSQHFHTRILTIVSALSLSAAVVMTPLPARGDDAPKPAPDTKLAARLKGQALAQEIAAQPEGIHKISDGSICIKSGPGMAHVHSDGRGCGTGCTANAARADGDNDLMTGVLHALILDPKEGTEMGIAAAQAEKIKAAYNYMDHMGTHPTPVLKLYEKYAKALEGKDKTDAEQILMDKVRAVGQAYLDGEAKKLKDVKALLTPEQSRRLRVIGPKMLRPFEKPIA